LLNRVTITVIIIIIPTLLPDSSLRFCHRGKPSEDCTGKRATLI
jgi:hypothetical protein